MAPIKTVAVAGATGNLGPHIVKQLLLAGFAVTILTRPGSKHTFPTGTTVVPVDYDSLDALTTALRGQDALVVALGAPGLAKQQLLLDASVAAGVRRFIPSEFGSDTSNPKTAALPMLSDKSKFQEVLRKKVAEPGVTLSFTGIINGPFLEFCIQIGLLTNVREHSTCLWDGGERPFSTTSLATVGRAVAAVLQHPAETANRMVYVQDTALTQRQISKLAQKALGVAAADWTETTASVADTLAEGLAILKNPSADPGSAVLNFITTAIFGDGYGGHFTKTDNALFGIPEISEENLLAVIRSVAN